MRPTRAAHNPKLSAARRVLGPHPPTTLVFLGENKHHPIARDAWALYNPLRAPALRSVIHWNIGIYQSEQREWRHIYGAVYDARENVRVSGRSHIATSACKDCESVSGTNYQTPRLLLQDTWLLQLSHQWVWSIVLVFRIQCINLEHGNNHILFSIVSIMGYRISYNSISIC